MERIKDPGFAIEYGNDCRHSELCHECLQGFKVRSFKFMACRFNVHATRVSALPRRITRFTARPAFPVATHTHCRTRDPIVRRQYP